MSKPPGVEWRKAAALFSRSEGVDPDVWVPWELLIPKKSLHIDP
jgi:hypothetical protein